jgi:hypothetical protein
MTTRCDTTIATERARNGVYINEQHGLWGFHEDRLQYSHLFDDVYPIIGRRDSMRGRIWRIQKNADAPTPNLLVLNNNLLNSLHVTPQVL